MSLSDLCTNFITTAKLRDESERNIIEFAEAPWGLGLGSSSEVPPLFPLQKFIFKCYYNIPLDNTDRHIIIKDKFLEKDRFRFTEVEYFRFLQDEHRINIKEVTGDNEDLRPDLLLVVGRRGLKTSSIAVLAAFETYKLLKKHCPQQYYKIMPDDEIRITCIATQKEQAGELFQRITGHLDRSEFFRKYRNKPTVGHMALSSQRDLEMYNGNRPSIRVVASPCSGRGLRGHNNIIAVLDEMAYFFEAESSTDRSDKTVFEAVTPSTAGFNSPEGEPHGKTICISSPGTRSGKFYELYERSFEPDNNNLLMIKAPSWEVDYTLSSKYMRSKFVENPISFDVEFGANFSDRVSAWIENEQVLRLNIIPGLKQKKLNYARIPHFMGVDIGLKNDGTAVAICHIEKKETENGVRNFIELDCIEVRYAWEEDKDFFTPEEMAIWISSFHKKFFIIKGFMDQYYGMAIIPLLVGMGHNQTEARSVNRDLTSRVWQNLMTKMLDGSLRIPEGDERLIDGKKTTDLDLIKELLTLRATLHSKYTLSVKAPEIKGMHDDLSDAFSRSVYLASEYMSLGGGVASSNKATSRKGRMTYKKYLRKSKGNAVHTNRPSTAIQSERYTGRSSLMRY